MLREGQADPPPRSHAGEDATPWSARRVVKPLFALEVIRVERDCCRFLEFTLRFDQDLDPVWLEMRGPEGTRAFLEALLRR